VLRVSGAGAAVGQACDATHTVGEVLVVVLGKTQVWRETQCSQPCPPKHLSCCGAGCFKVMTTEGRWPLPLNMRFRGAATLAPCFAKSFRQFLQSTLTTATHLSQRRQMY
jgi:hypothetical protein